MWKHIGGRFVYEQRANPRTFSVVSTAAPTVTTTPQPTTAADNGTFVDADNQPANGDVAVGVSNDGQVLTSGVVRAYVLDGNPIAQLSGIYAKTVNGVPDGHVVLTFDRTTKSFVIASTKSNELERLRDRLDALTTG